jgi:hypothetical protein
MIEMNDSNTQYRLVFTGNLLPGHSREQVVSRLQKLLRLEKAKAEKLVAGKHRQINKRLTLDRAERLRLMILKVGAECVLLPVNEESFVTTQQLPVFIQENAGTRNKTGKTDHSTEQLTTSTAAEPGESISSIRKRSSQPLSSNTKMKYLVYAIFIMVVEGVIIWQIRAPVPCDCAMSGSSPVAGTQDLEVNEQATKSNTPANSQLHTHMQERLRNLSVRTSLWFADQAGDAVPADTSWIWIQRDLGIKVKDMNDSWGNPIRYFGRIESFELRSAGADGRFYTPDDVYYDAVLSQ